MDDKYMEMRSLRGMVDEIEQEERRGVLVTVSGDMLSISLLGVMDEEAFHLLVAAAMEAEQRLKEQGHGTNGH